MTQFGQGHIAVFGQASRQAIEDAVRRLQPTEWLPPSNRYLADAMETLRIERKGGLSPCSSEIAEYLAVSVPLHCADGWGYLGHALRAHVNGDSDTSRHLAYYAELRGAMALLASEGIGVFNQVHVAVDPRGVARFAPGGPTHQILWETLEWWSGTPGAASLLAGVVRPAGVSIEDWVDALPAGGSWRIQGGDWIRQWGLDLQRFGSDRAARNASSYGPTAVAGVLSMPPSRAARFVTDLWNALEPTPGNVFSLLDRQLLRSSFEQVLDGKTQAEREVEVRAAAGLHIADPGLQEEFCRYLLRTIGVTEFSVVDLAFNSRRRGDSTEQHLDVISRAALILRVATGSAANLYAAAGRPLSSVDHWWRSLGEARGFWPPSGPTLPLTELWGDVEVALDDLAGLGVLRTGSTYHQMVQDAGKELSVLGGCERVGLWAMTA